MATTGKPVWIGWRLHERKEVCLGGDRSVLDAVPSVAGQPVSAFVVNCSTSEIVTLALQRILEVSFPTVGYANTFSPIERTGPMLITATTSTPSPAEATSPAGLPPALASSAATVAPCPNTSPS